MVGNNGTSQGIELKVVAEQNTCAVFGCRVKSICSVDSRDREQ